MRSSNCLFLVWFLFVCLTAFVPLPQVKANPSVGVTSDATYWYLESTNLKLRITKSNGLIKFYVGAAFTDWTSSKGDGGGGFSVITWGVGYNDQTSGGAGMPNRNPVTLVSQNSTYLYYKQIKASGPTFEQHTEFIVDAYSIQVIMSVKHLSAGLQNYAVAFCEWITTTNMKVVNLNDINNPVTEYSFGANSQTANERLIVDSSVPNEKPLYVLSNGDYALTTLQHPTYGSAMQYWIDWHDVDREVLGVGFDAVRGVQNVLTRRQGIILFATRGNTFSGLNKIPDILEQYVDYEVLDLGYVHLFNSPTYPDLITDSMLTELKARGITTIEIQWLNGTDFTNQLLLTHDETTIKATMTKIRSYGFKTYWYLLPFITAGFPANTWQTIRNAHSDSVGKDQNGNNGSNWGLLNPDPTYSWGTQVLSDVDTIISTYGDYFDGFFVDILVASSIMDFNTAHSSTYTAYFETGAYNKNASTLTDGAIALLQDLKAKGKPLIGNSPDNVWLTYYLDGVVCWDDTATATRWQSGTQYGNAYSFDLWATPRRFYRSGISSNVVPTNGTNDGWYVKMSYSDGVYPFIYAYTGFPTFQDAKTTFYQQNCWFLSHEVISVVGVSYVYLPSTTNTRLVIFNGTATGNITSPYAFDIYKKDGTQIALNVYTISLNSYLTSGQDIFVVKPHETNPYIFYSQSFKIESVSYSDNKFSFTVSASSGQISTTKVYVGDKGKPVSIIPLSVDGGFDSTTNIQTLTWTHSSSQEIILDWTIPSGPIFTLKYYQLTVKVIDVQGILQRDAKVTVWTPLGVAKDYKFTYYTGEAAFNLPTGTYLVTAEKDGIATEPIKLDQDKTITLTIGVPQPNPFAPLKEEALNLLNQFYVLLGIVGSFVLLSFAFIIGFVAFFHDEKWLFIITIALIILGVSVLSSVYITPIWSW